MTVEAAKEEAEKAASSLGFAVLERSEELGKIAQSTGSLNDKISMISSKGHARPLKRSLTGGGCPFGAGEDSLQPS